MVQEERGEDRSRGVTLVRAGSSEAPSRIRPGQRAGEYEPHLWAAVRTWAFMRGEVSEHGEKRHRVI